MRPVVTDGVALSACRSITTVNPAKSAKPTEVSFRLWARVGPRNHVLDGGPDPPMKMGNFDGKVAGH